MKKILPLLKTGNQNALFLGKLLLIIISLFSVLGSSAYAAVKPAYSNGHPGKSVPAKKPGTRNVFSPPSLSYATPQTYPVGVAITPLVPNSSGVSSPAYSNGLIGVGSGYGSGRGVAVDTAGNVYVADYAGNNLFKVPAGGGAAFKIGSGFNGPDGVAVDAAGNIYVSDYGNNTIKKLPVGGGAPVTICSTIFHPFGLASDAAGNIYVADNATGAIRKIPAGGGAAVLVRGGFNGPLGVAVDAAGNVYLGETGVSSIKKIPADGSATVSLGSGFNNAYGVAVDPVGNVFVGDANNHSVKEIPVGGGPVITLNNALSLPTGVAVDISGNIFVGDYNLAAVKKIIPVGGYYLSCALPAGLTFDGATGVISGTPVMPSPATDYQVTAYNGTGGVSAMLNIKVVPNTILSNLVLSTGTLTPVFDPGTTDYSCTVPYTTTSITITPTVNDANATVTVNGAAVTSGSASPDISLGTGANAIPVIVTAQDGITTTTYTVSVTRLLPPAPLAETQNASAVAVAGATLNGQVDDNGNTTTVKFVYGTSPTLAGTTKTVAATTGGTVNAGSGTTAAAVNITGLISKTQYYFMTTATSSAGTSNGAILSFTTLPSSNAIMASLSTNSGGPLSPAFASQTTAYTLQVPNDVTSIILTPVTTNAFSTVTVNGTPVISGTASAAVLLNVGANTVTTVVTAQDGVTKKTYTLTVTRQPRPFPIATTGSATSVAVATATLNGQVDDNGTNTTVNFIYGTSPTLSGTVKTVAATTGGSISAGSGATAASVNITSLASKTQYYFMISGTNAGGKTNGAIVSFVTLPSSNAILSGLTSSPGPLSPAFASQTTAYTLQVPTATASIILTPTTANASSTVTINGVSVTSGQPSAAIPLNFGANALATVVTAQDGITKKTYTVTVTRVPPPAPAATTGNASLVAVATATLSGQADDNGSTTMVSFVYGTSPTLSGTTKTVAATTGGTINAGDGNTAVSVDITSLISKTQYYYKVAATSPGGTTYGSILSFTTLPSSNAILSGLSASAGALSPAFASQTISYTIAVPNATSSTTIKPVTANAYSTVTVNGVAVLSGQSSASIPLAVGSNIITTVVTAQDGITTKTYKITITRAMPGLNAAYYSVTQTADNTPTVPDDGVTVHPALSPNGDGINDVLTIDGINAYPENAVTVVNRNGSVVFETKGYDNGSKAFDGHSNKTGAMEQAGTYFYTLDYRAGGEIKHKTGFIVLKY